MRSSCPACLTAFLLAALAGILLLCLPSAESRAASFSRARPLMGTIVEITVEAENRRAADAAMDRAFGEIARVDALMSSFRVDSEVSLLARRAGEGPVRVSPMLMEVLGASMRYYSISDRAFDVTAGPLVRLWGFTGGRRRVPSGEEIAAARALVGAEKVVLDRVRGTAFLSLNGMEIDLGGVAKGYAVDRAVEALRAEGVSDGVVNAGGDLFVLGSPECPAGLPVGIRHPLEGGKLLGWIMVREMAVATSGSYENFFVRGDKSYSHVIDPRSGYPVQGVVSATVLSPTTVQADALATALFVLGPEKGIELAEGLAHVEALVVSPGGKGGKLSLAATSGFRLNGFPSPAVKCRP